MSSSLLHLCTCRFPLLSSSPLSQNCIFVSRKSSRVFRVVRFCSENELPGAAQDKNQPQLLYSVQGDSHPFDVSDAHKPPSDHEGFKQNNGSRPAKALTSTGLMQKLKRYGISGVLSYGLLNTAYYLVTFILVWFYIAPAPGRMGYVAAVERFFKVMVMVWAGSQVTKLVRAGGALALAPFVDKGLSWFTVKFKFQSQGKAFMAIVGFCFGLALVLFFVVTLLWA